MRSGDIQHVQPGGSRRGLPREKKGLLKNRRAAFDAEGKVAANLNAWSDK